MRRETDTGNCMEVAGPSTQPQEGETGQKSYCLRPPKTSLTFASNI